MGKNILVASLGYAPGVVTGTVDALKFFDKVDIHKVLTISTCDPKIVSTNSCVEILKKEFSLKEKYSLNGSPKPFYDSKIEYRNMAIGASEIIDVQHNRDFLTLGVEQIHVNIQSADIDGIYISLAGGRKTMSSLMMTATKLIVDCYGSWEKVGKLRELTHLIVNDPEIEQQGDIDNLNENMCNKELKLKCLHPIHAFGNLAKEKIYLIRMREIFEFDFTDCLSAGLQDKRDFLVLLEKIKKIKM